MNKPVAWMLADKEAEHIRSIMAVQHDFVPEGCVEIPLYTHPVNPYQSITNTKIEPTVVSYTHPVKELTDEKITAISKEIFKDYKNFHHYQIDFARAVIKEVSGK